MKLIKKLFIIFIISLLFITAFIFFKGYIINFDESNNKKYDVKYFVSQIKNKGFLVTSELDYSGRINYKINKDAVYGTKWLIYREFIMIFDAKIEAGVDLSNIEITETETKIIVKMSKATIKDIYIIPESIEYYDIKNTPIKWGESDKEAANAAKIKAKEDVINNVNLNTLLNNAQTRAEFYIKSFIETGTNKPVEFENLNNNKIQEKF